MRSVAALLLLLCACVARPSDGDPDDPTGDDPTSAEPTGGETTSADESTSEPTTTAVTTIGTTVGTATATATFTTGEPPELSFEGDILPIFAEHCVAACHEPGGEWGFLLDLSASAYEATVGVPAPQFPSMSLVEPGEPAASYLWHKVSGTQASVGGSGIAMPKPRAGMTATVLTPAQLDTIEQWILQGAPP